MAKRILFITTLNLASNPRLVKELNLALQHDFEVELICFEFKNWSYEYDKELKEKYKLGGVRIHTIPAGRRPISDWLSSIIREKGSRLLSKFFLLKNKNLANAISRRNSLIINQLNNIARPGLVIGHNPGALYPTYLVAKKFKCAAGFDVEDYHPGEGNNFHLQYLIRQLMQEFIPQMDYVSFASPSIMAEILTISKGPAVVLPVLNFFPAEEFEEPKKVISGPVKMVWFSQNISKGRGLELILSIIKKFKGEVELHLFGNMDKRFYEEEIKNVETIFVHHPLSQIELHKRLSDFDVGLALEPAKDLNNRLALSNKILAYLQAGLYVLATKTPAQETFLTSLPDHGICFAPGTNDVAIFLKKIIEDIDDIRSKKRGRFLNFMHNNWTNESKKLLEQWNNIV